LNLKIITSNLYKKNMIHFNDDSWHYRLVLYVFGKNFFTERDSINWDIYEKTTDIIWTRKPKVVNFCPYCRGILWSVLSLPFVYVWRIFFPHDPTKEMTHAETMKRMKIRGILIRSIAGSVQFPFALMNYLGGNFEIAIVQVFIGFIIITTVAFIPENKHALKFFSSPPGKLILKILATPIKYLWLSIKPIVKRISKYFDEKEEKKLIKAKNPNIVVTYLQSKHHALCPPVCFIDKIDQENLK